MCHIYINKKWRCMFHTILEKRGIVSTDGVLERASWRQHERSFYLFFIFWRDGLAGKQGCKHDWRLGFWQEGGEEVPFYVSSIILATLPGLCASSLGGGWGLLRPVTRRLERLFHITVCLLFLTLTNLHSYFLVISLHLTHPMTCYHRTRTFLKYIFFHISIHPSMFLPSFILLFRQLVFPLFCRDVKQLTTCLVAGLHYAGVLLSLCVYRWVGASVTAFPAGFRFLFLFNLIPVSSMEWTAPLHKSWANTCFSHSETVK